MKNFEKTNLIYKVSCYKVPFKKFPHNFHVKVFFTYLFRFFHEINAHFRGTKICVQFKYMKWPYNPYIHHRRSIRLKSQDYSLYGIYFITICTKNREHLFGEIQGTNGWIQGINNQIQGTKICAPTNLGYTVEEHWKKLPSHYPNIILHDHIVMPNHFHGIIEIHHAVGAQIFVPETLSVPKRNLHQFQKIIPQSIWSIIRAYKSGVTVWSRKIYRYLWAHYSHSGWIEENIWVSPK